MICISINQESRRLALADMVNASRQCDLLEIRLDRFGKAPDLGEIFSNKPKPVIMCCRRVADGGNWEGSEEERLAILRQCIISQADYVELELDVADQVRRYGPTLRVISYTNLRETPSDIAEIYDEARAKNADVVKLTTLARTPEEAWPLVQILARATLPTVVVGLGKPGVMLSVLGQRIGAPWIYAALERGMEAYPGQVTVSDLESVYCIKDIQKGTRFVGVTGFGLREKATVGALNSVLSRHQSPFRCLPMGVGDGKIFRKVMEAVKLGAAIIDSAHQADLAEIMQEAHGAAKVMGVADLLLHKDGVWHGFHTGAQAWLESLSEALGTGRESAEPLKDRIVMILGLNFAAKIIAAEVERRGGRPILASRNKKTGPQIAQALGCRFVALEALYSTIHDALVVCDAETDDSSGKIVGSSLHTGYLKPGMVVMDLTAGLERTPLLHGAKQRGCIIVEPRMLLLEQLGLEAKLLTGHTAPPDVLEAAVPAEEE